MGAEKIKIAICDDEFKDRLINEESVRRYLEINSIDAEVLSFSTGKDLIEYDDAIDVLFLDIDLSDRVDDPQLDGIRIMENLIDRPNIWKIVFVSAHKERVFDAFGLKTLGFIEKPVLDEKMYHYLEIAIKELTEYREFEIECVDSPDRLRVSDIIYISSDHNYCLAHTKEGNYKIASNIAGMEKQLPTGLYVRIHKKYLVNLMYVNNMDATCKIKNDSLELPVGRHYLKEAKAKYVDFVRNTVKQRMM
ncbi:MAG: LytTR family DNA-binding domain-containing protein [Lachnospiraceae bacterium]|nr:LytTR family DNA-binding domain-containing protein [Lachnospiraceae bacterium]